MLNNKFVNRKINDVGKIEETELQYKQLLDKEERVMKQLIEESASSPFVFWIKGLRSRPERVTLQIVEFEKVTENGVILLSIWDGTSKRKVTFNAETELLEFRDKLTRKRKIMRPDRSTEQYWNAFAEKLIYMMNNIPFFCDEIGKK